jgi:metal-responsive CopG/Arc/MetJ family transcriptional regulator
MYENTGEKVMHYNITPTGKTRITVTLNRNLVKKIDQLVKEEDQVSRSQLVEEALQVWLKEHFRQSLERETEDYYRSLSLVEKNENRQWSNLSGRSAKRLWDR